MKQDSVWRKPTLLSWRQSLWATVDRWSQSSGWPLRAILQRLLMMLLLPLYLWRLGPSQGLMTFYRIFIGDGDFVVYRSERDPGTMVRGSGTDTWAFQQIFILADFRLVAGRNYVRVIIDAGAYVGFSSIYFAELYPHAFIYALEPDENNFQALQRNTRHYPNIKAIQAAVWNEDSFLEVENEDPDQWRSIDQLTARARIQKIPTVSIQSLMQQYRLQRIDILKLDIEGAETQVFAAPSCHAWLPRVRMLVLELHDHIYPDSHLSFVEAINQYECSVQSSGEYLIFEFPESLDIPTLELASGQYS